MQGQSTSRGTTKGERIKKVLQGISGRNEVLSYFRDNLIDLSSKVATELARPNLRGRLSSHLHLVGLSEDLLVCYGLATKDDRTTKSVRGLIVTPRSISLP